MPPPDDSDDVTRRPGGPDDDATGPGGDQEPHDSVEWDDDSFDLVNALRPQRDGRWDPRLIVGTTIDGRYAVAEKIGEGGFSYVFRARQLSVGRDVAIKLPASPADREAAARLRKGGALQGKLDHRSIAKVIDAGEATVGDVSLPCVVMDLVVGARRLTEFCRERCLDVRDRLAIFAAVCEGVGFAHAQGFVHRDLKPANILVNDAGEPRIIDFDTAWNPDVLSRTITESITSSGMVSERIIGTLLYMSPEHRAGETVTASSDVYALGVTLSELVSGRQPQLVASLGPHAGGALATIATRFREARPAALPPGIRSIVARCVHEEPLRRYANASELAEAVRKCLETGGWREPRWQAWSRSLARLATETPARLAAAFPARVLRRAALAVVVGAAAAAAGAAWFRERSRATSYAAAVTTAARSLANAREPGDALPVVEAAVERWRGWRGASPLPLELVCLRGLAGAATAPLGAGHALAFSPSGRWVAWGGPGGKVQARDFAKQPVEPHHLSGLAGDVVAVAFDRTDTLAAADARGACRTWNLATIKHSSWPTRIDADGAAGVFDLSPDGTRLALAMKTGAVEVRDARTNEPVCVVPAPEGVGPAAASAVGFSADGTRLFVAPGDGSLGVVDAATGVALERVAGLPVGPAALCRSADGTRLAAFVAGDRLRLHDPRTGRPLPEAGGEPSGCRHAAFGPDGRTLMVVRSDADAGRPGGIIELFDVSRGGRLRSEAVLPTSASIDGVALGAASRIAVRIDGAWWLWSDEAVGRPADATIVDAERSAAESAATTGS